ncbi:AraC family transcriptional regulator [Acinetobacter stercoris]|nr:AraC family transcriptional regulator [Acinetobacter stercoris]
MNNETNVEFWSHPDMPYVETRRACHSRICYKPHSHPTLSIGAVDIGQSCFSSVFATEQQIESGSLVVIPAHIEHSCNPLPDRQWSYQMMHLDAHWVAKLFDELSLSFDERLQESFTPHLKPKVIKNHKIYQSFTQLNDDLFSNELTVFEKEHRLIEMLSFILLPNIQWDELHLSPYLQSYLYDLVEYLNASEAFISLETLSEKVGISRYAIIRLFKNNFGLTPHAYQLNQKINLARERLKSGQQILHVAYDLGFSDQSHFHRVFKSFTGVTPKQYQQRIVHT